MRRSDAIVGSMDGTPAADSEKLMILNLTQHQPTADQSAAGLLPPIEGAADLLNFDAPPTAVMLLGRAASLAFLAAEAAAKAGLLPDTGSPGVHVQDGFHMHGPAQVEVLIGGLPALMGPLELALKARFLKPVYAFSERVSEEQAQADGSVRKVNVFRHVGFYPGAL